MLVDFLESLLKKGTATLPCSSVNDVLNRLMNDYKLQAIGFERRKHENTLTKKNKNSEQTDKNYRSVAKILGVPINIARQIVKEKAKQYGMFDYNYAQTIELVEKLKEKGIVKENKIPFTEDELLDMATRFGIFESDWQTEMKEYGDFLIQYYTTDLQKAFDRLTLEHLVNSKWASNFHSLAPASVANKIIELAKKLEINLAKGRLSTEEKSRLYWALYEEMARLRPRNLLGPPNIERWARH